MSSCLPDNKNKPKSQRIKEARLHYESRKTVRPKQQWAWTQDYGWHWIKY